MTVIASNMLLVRRIGELQRRRAALLDKQERLRGALPDWTIAPLKLAGMSAREIEGLVSDLSQAETEAGLDEIERELDRIDQLIEDLENQLITTPSKSLDCIQSVLDMAIARMRQQTVADPSDVFYDYGDARILYMLERVADDLRAILREELRSAG
jgi:hypothetical protein